MERQAFKVLQKTAKYEIRSYEKSILATTTYQQDSPSFQRLASYIFGNPEQKIAMTSPVVTTRSSMSFVLPSSFKKISDLPLPDKDLDVKLEEKGPMKMAVLEFSWFTSDDVVEAKGNELLEALKEQDQFKVVDPPLRHLFRYNPPWTLPFLRTNEVAYEVQEKI